MRMVVIASMIMMSRVLFAMGFSEKAESPQKISKIPLCEAVFVMEVGEPEEFSERQSGILEHYKTESKQGESEDNSIYSNNKKESYSRERRSSIDMYYDAYAKFSKKNEEKLGEIKEGTASK